MNLLKDFHLIKFKNTYLGYNKHGCKPTIYTFNKLKHAKKIRHSLEVFEYDFQHYQEDTYKMTVVEHRRMHDKRFVIESKGYFDTQIVLQLNNIDMFIVDDVIEDDDANMYLMNRKKIFIPIQISDKMIKKHLQTIYTSL